MTEVPYSKEAEESVIGQMLASPDCIGQVTATLLEGSHFYIGAHRVLYDALVDAFYADDPIDPLTIAERCQKPLARLWGCEESYVPEKVRAYTQRVFQGAAQDHAHVVKQHSDLRKLLDLAATIQREVSDEALTPDQIAGRASTQAMKIATSAVTNHEVVSFGDAGRNFVKVMKERMALKQAGIEPGAKFNIGAIDAFTRGIQPTELFIAGGEPGVGKSSVWWKAAMNFAERQMKHAEADRVGSVIFSLEMGDIPSSTRWAQSLTGIDGGHMREGDTSQDELRKIVTEWGRRKDYPLYLNYASGLRLSQLRAIVSEEIRKHNVGLVIIDHFLLLWPDDPRGMSRNEIDDEVVVFLKNQLAKELNVAVVCLAHTRKAIERADKRPRLADLRGAGTIAAFADFVGLMFRPYAYASEKERDSGKVQPTDAEMIHAKNRHGIDGTGNFYFDASRMLVI